MYQKLLVGNNIDFKFCFKKPILTFKSSRNMVSLIYGDSSIIVDIGESITSSLIASEQSDGSMEKIRTFNELASTFKRCML